ncbi:MAG: hypothetical protein KGQ40_15750, partial [Rhodospirillales bacterium]|nr:hypothetical protein [Rhodospirillales bacterium]
MTKASPWRGVRLRRTTAAADPDSASRPVSLPAAWEPRAAAALAALAPGSGAAALEAAAAAWIGPLAARAAEAGIAMPLGEALHRLLLTRRGAPESAI